MKLLHYIVVTGISLFTLISCESNLERTIYDETKVKPAILSGLEESYVLDKTKGSENALSLNWTKPDMGYAASATSLLEMDLKDKNFNSPVVLSASIEETTYSATVSDFNKQIMSLFSKYEMEYTDGETVELAFRVGSYISTVIDTVYSDIVITTVTPYAGEAVYPMISVRGDYCGWSYENSQFVYSSNSDENYAGMIYFDGKAQNGWKFCKEENWNNGNWGTDGEGTIPAEASEITLISGGQDIKAYSRKSYWVEFNSTTGVLKMSQGYDSWGIVGGFNHWKDVNAVDMSYGCDENGAYLVLTQEFPDGDTWKIISDKSWGKGEINVNNISYEGDVEDAGADGNFKLNKGAGMYTIKWYFNKVQPILVVTKK